jgi:hypothetical protein
MRRGTLLSVTTCTAVLVLAGTAQATLSWNPASINFGQENIGSTSPSQQVTLMGGQRGPDIFDGMNFIPGPSFPDPLDIAVSGDFTITSNSCPAVLLSPTPGTATCAVRVAFEPNAVGPLQGFLRLQSNPSIQGVPLKGVGCKKPKKGKAQCKKGKKKKKKK